MCIQVYKCIGKQIHRKTGIFIQTFLFKNQMDTEIIENKVTLEMKGPEHKTTQVS